MPTIRIATRSSPMAVHQAEQVATALEALDPTVSTELVKVTTAGDRYLGDLATLGGKGAFIKEIDRALLDDQALEMMCPPIGAGIIALQCRAADVDLLALGAHLDDADTHRQADAERAMLHALQGHCNSPIAGYATTDVTGRLSLHGKVFSSDGSQWLDSHHWGVAEDPQALGFFVGSDLLRQGARVLIDAIAH